MKHNFYSQHGEDFLLHKIFQGKRDGFFVEVGCIDGRRFSNSLHFEEIGWKGMCVEAHEGYIEQLRLNRPESIVCHFAVGSTDQEKITFFANSRGSLSTLDSSKEMEFKQKFGDYFSGFEQQNVSLTTLNTLFQKHDVTHIDFLSIDIEGYEVEALMGLDLNKYSPEVFVIESDSKEHEIRLDEILLKNAMYYKSNCRLNQNLFYFRHRNLASRIENRMFQVELIWTRHPLDEGDDQVENVTISSRTEKTAQSFPKENRLKILIFSRKILKRIILLLKNLFSF